MSANAAPGPHSAEQSAQSAQSAQPGQPAHPPADGAGTARRQHLRQWLRWLAPVAAIVALLVIFRDRLPFLSEAWDALSEASLGPLAAAVASALAAIAAMSGVMQVLLNLEGRICGPRRTNAVVLASNAWSTTVPGGPAFSAWLTFRVQRAWGAPVGLCGFFFVISGALSTVWMVVIGAAAVVLLGAQLSVWTLGAMFAAAAGTTAAIFWATLHPAVLKRWVRYLPERLRGRVSDVVDEVAAIRMRGGEFAAAAALSLFNQILDVATMYFAVWAVLGSPPGVTAGLNEITVMGVTLAYIMTKLAGAAQITPGGFGTVEPVAAAMLVAGGMTLVHATAATVVYRAVSFALITAIGWVVYAAVYAGRGFMAGRPAAGKAV
ncbi:YbhN family protein [Corynebacterium sp. Marseille-P4321]|uniref:lysylphosphatidylglycerol synthase transmembrane domain-containing protein n=1 Tax=Corynebacterium sp. Marseille-P4321 TaxID=2736603 RepID=UPI0020CA5F56|nr:YbhN family protein [Corynebacterium sp. Marseille-P4321]